MLDWIMDGMWAYWVVAYLAFLIGLQAQCILNWLSRRKFALDIALAEIELATDDEIETARRLDLA